MSKWKYHLDPHKIPRDGNVPIGIYCSQCKKLAFVAKSETILRLLAGELGIAAVVKCRKCNETVQVDIFKHLVYVKKWGRYYTVCPPYELLGTKTEW